MKRTVIPVTTVKKLIISNLREIETDRKPLHAKIIAELEESGNLDALIGVLKKNIYNSNPTGTFCADAFFNTWSNSKLRIALNKELSLLERYLANEEERHLKKVAFEEYKVCELKINPVIPSILGSGLQPDSKLKQDHLDQINQHFKLILKTAPTHRFDTYRVNNILSKTQIELEEELKGEEKPEYDEELEQLKTLFGFRANQFNCVHSFIYKTEPHNYNQFLLDNSIAREQQLKDIIKNMREEDIDTEKRSDCNYLAVTMLKNFMISNPKHLTNLNWIAEKILLLTQSTLNPRDLIAAAIATNAPTHLFSV